MAVTEWMDDLIELALWAAQSVDLRHRFLAADEASDVNTTPGIWWASEASLVLAIFEAALAKGYKNLDNVAYETAFDGREAGNPRRADLAFKTKRLYQKWAHVEVKWYGPSGKAAVAADIEKLQELGKGGQRWMLVYRMQANSTTGLSLKKRLEEHFDDHVSDWREKSFSTWVEKNDENVPGICELVMMQV